MFAIRLKEIRKVRGLTQQEASDGSGVPLGTLIHLEINRKPSFQNLMKLCNFYQVPSDYLLGFINKPYPNQVNNLQRKIAMLTHKERKLIESFILNIKGD